MRLGFPEGFPSFYVSCLLFVDGVVFGVVCIRYDVFTLDTAYSLDTA